VIGRRPASPGRLERPLKWINDCIRSHKSCASYQKIVSTESSFPTRVIDVGLAPDDTLRLVFGSGLTGNYAVLSHCWGTSPIIKTTKAGFDEFTKCIEVEKLGKVFRDAVSVTKGLGLRYLWIDSLCIIQDDPGDWEAEAANMAQIYSQAFVTIAACAASDGSKGLFPVDLQWPSVKLSSRSRSGQNRDILVGQPLHRFQSLSTAPLSTRAWTLQERILSTRILHYGSDQVHWECREVIKSEGNNPPYGAYLDSSQNSSFHDGWLTRISNDLMQDFNLNSLLVRQHSHSRSPYDSWYGMVAEYTKRNLSYADDKLPALSGLARVYSKRYGVDYVAGLWAQDLWIGLLWYSKENEPLSRPQSYRAPSWSWASVDGPVDFFSINAGQVPTDTIDFEDGEHWIDLAGKDPYGRVKGGTLTLKGYIREARIRTIEEEDEYEGVRLTKQIVCDEISAIGSATLDTSMRDGPIWCLRVSSSYLNNGIKIHSALVLLLSPTENQDEWEFRREGFAAFFESRVFNPDRTLRPTQTVDEWKNPYGGDGADAQTLEGWFEDGLYEYICII
jgi:hypothetical protein